jgi:hypothetical protein
MLYCEIGRYVDNDKWEGPRVYYRCYRYRATKVLLIIDMYVADHSRALRRHVVDYLLLSAFHLTNNLFCVSCRWYVLRIGSQGQSPTSH